MAKIAVFNKCTTEFLRELATEINLSQKNYRKETREELLKVLKQKLRSSDIDIIFKRYTLCLSASEIAEKIKPNDTIKLTKSVERFLGCDEYLHEIVVRRHKCDIVGFKDSSIMAIETKSARDDMRHVVSQIVDYGQWANEVYIAYDEAHGRKMNQFSYRNLNVGLLEVSKSGNVTMLRSPDITRHNSHTLLSLVARKILQNLARTYHISPRRNKNQIVSELSSRIDEKAAIELLKSYLKFRTKLVKE